MCGTECLNILTDPGISHCAATMYTPNTPSLAKHTPFKYEQHGPLGEIHRMRNALRHITVGPFKFVLNKTSNTCPCKNHGIVAPSVLGGYMLWNVTKPRPEKIMEAFFVYSGLQYVLNYDSQINLPSKIIYGSPRKMSVDHVMCAWNCNVSCLE